MEAPGESSISIVSGVVQGVRPLGRRAVEGTEAQRVKTLAMQH